MVKNKSKSFNNLLLGIVAIFVLNYLGSFVFARFDLTSEKRYSLSDPSINQVEKLDSTLLFTIYLEGEFPAKFKRLKTETKEMLDEFRAYNSNLDYEFVNLNDIENKKERLKAQKKLIQLGVEPYPVTSFENGEEKRTVIFPAAIVEYKNRKQVFSILKNQQGLSEEQIVSNSINTLEYRIASAIKAIAYTKKPAIAFLEGHYELNDYEVADITYSLNKSYNVRRGAINNMANVLDSFKCVIVTKPTTQFSEQDKFVIDRYVINGGKIIWMIDGSAASMDSIRTSKTGNFFAYPLDLNLNDILFKYGIRINGNLLLDQFCDRTPMVVGMYENKPKFEQIPWPYFPLIIANKKHVTTKNLSPITTKFTSTIDTIKAKGVRKTILLQSSEKSKIVNTPAEVKLADAQGMQRDPSYNIPPQNVAVLLEGTFPSIFKNRPIPKGLKTNRNSEKSTETKMIVIADGDLVKNEFDKKNRRILPLRDHIYGNKDFIINCVDYLVDDSGLIDVRNKEVKTRLLNKNKIKNHRTYWQLLNVGLPVLLIVIWGLTNWFIRRKKYA